MIMKRCAKNNASGMLHIAAVCCLSLLLISLPACATKDSTVENNISFDHDISSNDFAPVIEEEEEPKLTPEQEREQELARLSAELGIVEDYRAGFDHGAKEAEHQRYIVLHDTEGTDHAQNVINWWDSNGNLVAAHFIVNTDGTVWQCVPLDRIAHHAGYGNAGHNDFYGIVEDGRDDMLGTVSIGSTYPDYGMNAYSIGIEMVHVGGSGTYPEEQLIALDKLIAYIDAYYGFESTIIDHKAWRTDNSDTSLEFAQYLQNYQTLRNHTGA